MNAMPIPPSTVRLELGGDLPTPAQRAVEYLTSALEGRGAKLVVGGQEADHHPKVGLLWFERWNLRSR